MRRKFLCGLAALLWSSAPASVLSAQPVPARDLWDFPLGAVLEPAALASEAGAGIGNPASIAMPASTRFRLGVAALSASANSGVDAQLVSGTWRRKGGTTVGFSIARASVSGIVRTDTDPTGLGSVDYSTVLASATFSRELLPHLTGGVSARYRDGRTDLASRSALAADLGFVLDSIPWHDLRLAASSFLWRPGRESEDQPALLAAGDFRVLPRRTAPNIRVGYQRNITDNGIREHGPFASAQTGVLEVRGALVVTTVYGHSNNRARSGLLLHFARYVVGIGREEGSGGLGPLYQFTLSSLVK